MILLGTTIFTPVDKALRDDKSDCFEPFCVLMLMREAVADRDGDRMIIVLHTLKFTSAVNV